MKRVKNAEVSFFYQDTICLGLSDGFEAFAYPEDNHGVAVALINPAIASQGYRFKVEDFNAWGKKA